MDSVSQADYKNDLDGLVGYLKALQYLPKDTQPVDMLAEVIGAKKGYRYIFTVNGSQTVTELYEFDTAALDANAQRVIGEIKENGSFHLFNKEGVDTDTTYTAYLSDNGKYMMLYTDNSSNDDNVIRTKSIQKVLKDFYATEPKKDDKEESQQTSASESSAPEVSKPASSAAEESNTASSSEASQTENTDNT